MINASGRIFAVLVAVVCVGSPPRAGESPGSAGIGFFFSLPRENVDLGFDGSKSHSKASRTKDWDICVGGSCPYGDSIYSTYIYPEIPVLQGWGGGLMMKSANHGGDMVVNCYRGESLEHEFLTDSLLQQHGNPALPTVTVLQVLFAYKYYPVRLKRTLSPFLACTWALNGMAVERMGYGKRVDEDDGSLTYSEMDLEFTTSQLHIGGGIHINLWKGLFCVSEADWKLVSHTFRVPEVEEFMTGPDRTWRLSLALGWDLLQWAYSYVDEEDRSDEIRDGRTH